MKFKRIKALIWRDYLVFFQSKWRFLEVFYFPITSIIIWGFFALWTGETQNLAGKIALTINIFWSYAYVVQSTINLAINEDAWHNEVHHLYITGIGKWEYLLSKIIFGLLLSLANLLLIILISHFFFLNISKILIEVLLISFLTAFISIGIATLIAGLFFALGKEYAWFSWTLLQFFVLFSFPLFPLESLPSFLQKVAIIMPFGNIFEAGRNILLAKEWFS